MRRIPSGVAAKWIRLAGLLGVLALAWGLYAWLQSRAEAEQAANARQWWTSRATPAKPTAPETAEAIEAARVQLEAGRQARRAGDFEAAVAAFERARALRPRAFEVLRELATVLWFAQRYDEALAVANVALDIQSGQPALLGIKLVTLWNLQGLRGGQKKLDSIRMQSAPIDALRAQQFLLEGNDARAGAYFELAIAASERDEFSPVAFAGRVPLALEWQLQLAAIEARRMQRDAATLRYQIVLAHADAALQDATAAPADQAAWQAVRGMALAGLGRQPEAVAAGQRALALAPASADAFEAAIWPAYLARIHAANGEAAEAVAVLRAGLAQHRGIDSVAMLRLDPAWGPIRQDPAFQALLTTP